LAVQFGTVQAGLAAGGYPTKIGDAALFVAKAGNRIAEPHRLVSSNLAGPPLGPRVEALRKSSDDVLTGRLRVQHHPPQLAVRLLGVTGDVGRHVVTDKRVQRPTVQLYPHLLLGLTP